MTNKELLNLKTGDKIKAKKLDYIFEVKDIADIYNGLLTLKEMEKIKPIKKVSVKKIKGFNYPKWVKNDMMFIAKEIEKVD